MASRENQALQLSLIFFVAVTVILAVVCYMLWKKADEAQTAQNSALSAQRAAETSRTQAVAENRKLREIIGVAPDASMADVETSHAEDMQAYGQLLLSPVDNYRALLALYEPQWVAAAQVIASTESETQTLRADVAAARGEQAAGVQAAEAGQAQAIVTYNQGRETYEQTLAATIAAEPETIALLEAAEALIDEEGLRDLVRTEFESRIAEQESELRRLREILAGMKGETLDSPDGQISWVSPESDVVYINIGSADYLQRQTTFSVYEAGEGNLGQAVIKGSIEVTALLEPHLAEARILSDSLENPILRGDLIFSPVWQPGRQVHYAMVGMMDVDGDGEDDTDLVRRLITSNGGTIDEGPIQILDSEGNPVLGADGNFMIVTGPQLSVETRYLVQGDRPDDRSTQEALRLFSTASQRAQQLNVETISVDRLLDLMGYEGSERSVGLGEHSDPDDFRPRPPTGRGNSQFRERRPPAGDNGAY